MSHHTGAGIRRVAIGLLVALPALTAAACSLTIPPGRYTVRGLALYGGRCQNKPMTVIVHSGRNNPIQVDCLRYLRPDA